jgi:predicted exporter
VIINKTLTEIIFDLIVISCIMLRRKFIYCVGGNDMADNEKKKVNKNLKILGVALGWGIIAIFSVIFNFMTLQSAIISVVSATIGATVARILSR